MQKVSSVYKEHANSGSISLLLPPEWFLGFLCVLPEGASRLSVSCQHAGHQLHEVFGLAWGNRKMWNMTGFDINFKSTECNMTGQSREDRMKKNTSILLKTKKIRKLTAHITKETPAYLSISDLTLRYSQNCLSGGNLSIWKPCQVSFQALFYIKASDKWRNSQSLHLLCFSLWCWLVHLCCIVLDCVVLLSEWHNGWWIQTLPLHSAASASSEDPWVPAAFTGWINTTARIVLICSYPATHKLDTNMILWNHAEKGYQ